MGIAGLISADRTELLRGLFGLDAVREGRVRLAANVGGYSPVQRWSQNLDMVSEDRQVKWLATSMSVADKVILSKLADLGLVGMSHPNRQD